jgi:hypothetical protein
MLTDGRFINKSYVHRIDTYCLNSQKTGTNYTVRSVIIWNLQTNITHIIKDEDERGRIRSRAAEIRNILFSILQCDYCIWTNKFMSGGTKYRLGRINCVWGMSSLFYTSDVISQLGDCWQCNLKLECCYQRQPPAAILSKLSPSLVLTT